MPKKKQLLEKNLDSLINVQRPHFENIYAFFSKPFTLIPFSKDCIFCEQSNGNSRENKNIKINFP